MINRSRPVLFTFLPTHSILSLVLFYFLSIYGMLLVVNFFKSMPMFYKWLKNNVLYVAFLLVLVSILGSLYFSEVMNFAPCVLCWYQRILMYPLAIILLVGIWKKDQNVTDYVLPFSVLGFLIALYHNLLYYNIIPESLRPCRVGVSCTTKYLEIFGFITIPLMSLVAFAFITACMIFYKKLHKNNN